MSDAWIVVDGDKYLTAMAPGKTRRGWSKHRDKAARFDTVDSAEAAAHYCASPKRYGYNVRQPRVAKL